jgi:lipoate-protein ligase A
MKLLDLTLPTPAENLALDEALLDSAEADPREGEVLRLWELASHAVVMGRSSNAESEVNLPACRSRGVPVLRRSSGGAAIVAGPGCLMYAVVLSYKRRPHLRMLDEAHRYVLSQVAAGIRTLGVDVKLSGTSDLAWNDRKVSGNSLRCKRDHFLYHGTILYDFDLPLLGELLRWPPRQPEYRRRRPHGEFVTNLPVKAADLRQALAASFAAHEPLEAWPHELTARLVAERYATAEWNR